MLLRDMEFVQETVEDMSGAAPVTFPKYHGSGPEPISLGAYLIWGAGN